MENFIVLTVRLLNAYDGSKSWWLNGNLHRTDGPAKVERVNGIKEWYFEEQKVEPMFHECKVDDENGTKRYYQ
jgi:hypothetical protein